MESSTFRFPDPAGASAAEPPADENTNATPSSPSTVTQDSPNGTDVLSPVYWQHSRTDSQASQRSIPLTRGITLEDHTENPSETSSALWARSIIIADYVVVRGRDPAGVGAYVVWNCKVETLDGGPIFIRKRYSEFDKLRENLTSAFPRARNALPALPPKSVFMRFQPKFLEKRRNGLSYFLNCVMLNPEFAGSPILKDFIFARED